MATTLSRTYTHRTLSSEQIIEMLKTRGLTIADESAAITFLKDVSYFRLAAYLRPMEMDKATHQYKPTATFENAVALYRFDNSLRELVFRAIQHIEIYLRTRMIQEFSAADPFWFFDESLSQNKHNFLENLNHIERDLQRSKEDFIKEHYRRYGADCFPPAWKTLETITLGSLSKLFSNHNDTKAKKRIARSYGIPQHEILENWTKTLNAIRNNCAHHARLWNRYLSATPQLNAKMRGPWISHSGVESNKLYAALSCLLYWLSSLGRSDDFKTKTLALLKKYPNVDISAMGFPANWQSEPLWK